MNWIKRIKPFIDKYAKDMLTKLSAAYQASFPSGEIIVDLSAEVGPNLAFTTKGPAASAGHIIISPEKNADSIVAFETIFHETSHIVDGQIMKHINDAAAKEKVNVPDDLWHGMIFFTAAELTKKELNLPEFTPYYIKSGIATSNDYWRKIFGALKDAWQPYLNHQTTFNNAMSQVVIKASAN